MEMVRRCCVKDCRSEWWPGTGLSFHSFPRNEEMRRKWINAIPNSAARHISLKYATVCSLHFTEHCYAEVYNHTQRTTLKKDAVPTLFGEDIVPEYIDLEELAEFSDDEETNEEDPLRLASPSQLPEQSEKTWKKDAVVQTIPQKRTIDELEEEYNKRELELRKRLKKAEDKIQQLKTFIDAPEQRNQMDLLEEAIQKHVPENRRAIIWNELFHHASPGTSRNYEFEMKDFAMTVYLYSPQAYEYLRERMTLPHSSTVRKWLR